jgi:caa(3)-type oxidase subunit IV
MAHAQHQPAAAEMAAPEHHFPEKAWGYVKIGVVLFILTALEVAGYEVARKVTGSALDQAWFVPVILLLSALKFALVALHYMHLKWDGRFLKGIFAFSLFIAAIVIVALMVLFIYHRGFWATLPKVG